MTRLTALCLLATALCAAQARTAVVKVEIRDRSSKQLIPARIYLVDQQGALHVPENTVVYRRHQEQHFLTAGSFSLPLAEGDYALTVERGPEYRPWSTKITVAPGEPLLVKVALERWIDMNARGWYSGDLHNHRKLDEMPRILLAEDLNVAPTLTDWIWEDRPSSRPPDTSEAIRPVDASHVFSVLDKEIERLNHGPGAVDLLALKTTIPFEGGWLYPPNDVFCRLAHAQGGYVDAEKILWRDVPALVALGHIDFAGVVHNHFNRHGVELETDRWGMTPRDRPEFETPLGMALWTLDIYYRFLNCGFRLPVSAGSASGVKAAPLGHNRVYAHIDGPFSYENWFRALKEGRSFATNGPMLFVSVNGRLPGSTLEFQKGEHRRLSVKAEVESARPIGRLEVVFNGRVVKTVEGSSGIRKLKAELSLPAGESGWVAARAFETPQSTIRFAQTSPVYIRVGGRPYISAADARYFAAWMRREKAFYQKELRFKSPQHREAMIHLFEQAEAVYTGLAADAAR